MGRKPKNSNNNMSKIEENTNNNTERQIETIDVPLYRRDPRTGLIRGVNYVFNEDGSVNWRQMVKPEHLVANRDKFPADTDLHSLDVQKLDDDKLLILLAGIKELCQLRGYTNIDYKVEATSDSYVAVKCNIDWMPNFETNDRAISFSSLADAHLNNTYNFASNFLMAIAENRAFVRAVRNFLRINITGKDELGDGKNKKENRETETTSMASPTKILEQVMNEVGLTFIKIRDKLTEEGNENASKWESINDIPAITIFDIINRIKNKNKK